MRHLCLWLALLALAPSADAARFTLTLDGQVNSMYGTGPSLTSLGLAYGTPLHYEVLVDTGADGLIAYPDGSVEVVEDQWFAPDDYQEIFYAELLVEPFEVPGSWGGFGRVSFVGVDDFWSGYSCAPLGRLFVGVDLFHIDSCGGVASWTVGQDAGLGYLWRDPTTNEDIYVYGSVTVTEVTPLAEPASGMLAALSIALLARVRR